MEPFLKQVENQLFIVYGPATGCPFSIQWVSALRGLSSPWAKAAEIRNEKCKVKNALAENTSG
jgi:hypothetical protein